MYISMCIIMRIIHFEFPRYYFIPHSLSLFLVFFFFFFQGHVLPATLTECLTWLIMATAKQRAVAFVVL